MIAGILSFLASEYLGFYKFSNHSELYITVLLSYIFCCFPLSISSLNTNFLKNVKTLWQYSALQFFSQWGLSLLFVIVVLKNYYPFVEDWFGVILPSGFAGGHGSAAVVGGLLKGFGNSEALTLGMAMATIGALISLIGGLFWIAWAKRKGLVENFNINPKKEKNRVYWNFKTFTLISMVVVTSFYTQPLIVKLIGVHIPVFIVSVLFSVIIRVFKPKLKIDRNNLESVTNISTDILVYVGIASIKLLIIAKYIEPLICISILGVLVCVFFFKKLGLKIFEEDSFSKAIFTWGWSVGGLVFGLALVKMLKQGSNMKILEQFAFTYLLLAPIEVALILSMPYLVMRGYGLYASVPLILLSLVLIKILHSRSDKLLK